MIKLITRNFLWKLLALAAAFGIWLNVENEPELATIVSVPVEYNNFPKDLEISSDIVDSLDVEAHGPAGLLRSLQDARVAAIIDFANVKAPGERTFTVTRAEVNLPRGIDLVRTIPAQLRFKFEKRATRTVPVTVPFSGKMAPGLSIAQVDIQPPQLRIGGPESHVLGAVKLTSDPFDLSNVTGNSEQSLSVYAPESEVRILSEPRVKVSIRVERKR